MELVKQLEGQGATVMAMDCIPRTLSRGQTYDALSSQVIMFVPSCCLFVIFVVCLGQVRLVGYLLCCDLPCVLTYRHPLLHCLCDCFADDFLCWERRVLYCVVLY